jgi:hypothetical protein
VFNVQPYQTSQYVLPCGGIFLGKWRSSFAGSSGDKNECPISLRSEHPIDKNLEHKMRGMGPSDHDGDRSHGHWGR